MNFLFIHQNYPGQYREILPRLISEGGHSIDFLTQRAEFPEPRGLRVHRYKPADIPDDKHPYTSWYQRCIATGLGAARAASVLRQRGLRPDVIIGHAGWGELIFMKEVFPDVPLLGYFEYFFIAKGGMIGFDPEFRESADISARLRARNAPNYLSLEACDDGYSASQWQKETYPPLFHEKVKVFHEGIRTDRLAPDHQSPLRVEIAGQAFTRDDEIVTYIARNLEPSRGFHQIMRALPDLQARRPAARVAIIGGDDVSYGGRLPGDETFRQKLTGELGDRVDWSRVHFLGRIPYDDLFNLLRLARVHVYLTTPFVVSWSLLEAMALEKTIVASDVAPVRQYLEDGRTGFLVDFFSPAEIAARISGVLEHPDHHREVGEAARRHVVANYDFETVCYPQFKRFIANALAARG